MNLVFPQVAEALNYLHSQSFIYRDLKPGNVLVWKFPLPQTQWTGDQTVQLKLADYGISQQFTPQGVRGLQGTPPYLPPEVLLHGGLETYSTKLDVYSFGMFMYFLFTFCNPFQKEGIPPATLLEAGKRPELLLKVSAPMTRSVKIASQFPHPYLVPIPILQLPLSPHPPTCPSPMFHFLSLLAPPLPLHSGLSNELVTRFCFSVANSNAPPPFG